MSDDGNDKDDMGGEEGAGDEEQNKKLSRQDLLKKITDIWL